MAMSFGRFLARNILTLTKSNPLPLCRIHAINRFIDNPLKAAAIGIRFESTRASSKARTTTAGAKRTAKGRPATAKKTTAGTTSKAKRTVTKAKSTAVKKKPAAKKHAPRRKEPAKKKSPKVLTPKQLERQKRSALKELVLAAPKVPNANPYSTFVSLESGAVSVESGKKWRALTPEQQQEWAEKGKLLHQTGLQNREKWVKSLNPQEVYKANKARKHLKRLGGKVSILKDPRMPKRPAPVHARFLKDQWSAGTFNNPDGTKMGAIAALRHSRDLFEKLSATEKKAYEDRYAAERVAYKKAVTELLGDINKL